MPKSDLLQNDFGQGEISPRAQGQIGTDLYRASLSRVANAVPTQERSMCSRTGGRVVPRVRASDGNTGNGNSVRLFGLTNGPFPGQAIETDWTPAGNTQSTRIFDKRGAVSFHEKFVMTPWTFANGFFLPVTSRYDDDEDVIYLRANDTAVSGQQALGVGPPATTGDFTLEFAYSGKVKLTVSDPTGVTVWYTRTFDPTVPGDNIQSVTFTPAGTFILKWEVPTLNGPSVRISKMLLWKDKMKFITQTTGGAQFAPTGCETFWKAGSYYVIMWDQKSAPIGLVYTPPAVAGDRTNPVWAPWTGLAFATFVPGAIIKYQNRLWFAANDGSGRVMATVVGYGAGAGAALALSFTIAAPPKAVDGMDMLIAGSRVNWMRELRGLMIGSLVSETQFVQLNGGAMALDPAAGLAIDVIPHSNHGSDTLLPALGCEDQIVFPLRGRQKFMIGSLKFLSQGGFKSENFSLYGEHLLNAKVRFYCILISPVPRLVFVMDDGTGAVATVTSRGVAWSRLTHWRGWAWCANVETLDGSELWMVDNAQGHIVRIPNLEAVTPPTETSWLQAFLTPAVAPDYNTPPVMDNWVRVGIRLDVNGKPVPANTEDYAALVAMTGGVAGTLAHVITVQGEYLGTYDLGTQSGQVGQPPPPVLTGLTPTYVDAGGNVLPQEVFIGIAYPEHRAVTLPLEGGNPSGTSQGLKSRKPQLYVKFVDSYLPLVNGRPAPERQPGDTFDIIGGRVTGPVRYTELGFTRGAVVEVSQPLPLRFEFTAIFGGTEVNEL